MVCLDHRDRWLTVHALRENTAEATAPAFIRGLAGQSWPEVVKTDDGREFTGAFSKAVVEHGARHEVAVPRRPNTHAPVESMNRTLLGAVRASLVSSGLPARFWEDATLHFAFVWNRAHRPNGSPHEARHQVLYRQDKLLPFGCAVMYFDDEASKFAARARLGVLIRYHEESAIVVVDAEELASGRTREIVTRDFVPRRGEYPARRLGLRPLGERIWLEDEYEAGDGPAAELCGRCHKRRVTAVACPRCLGRKARRHRRDATCAIGACRCSPAEILSRERRVAARAERETGRIYQSEKRERERAARALAAEGKRERKEQKRARRAAAVRRRPQSASLVEPALRLAVPRSTRSGRVVRQPGKLSLGVTVVVPRSEALGQSCFAKARTVKCERLKRFVLSVRPSHLERFG
ncbi:Retrovirus-related Pol polyprotein from transposon TNT 1-94 [Porphyridium purpureum]|uniref:Retrovirus-related Pol polyprotein from transposon TNT 1-94 n=1 Tax=Porphyridium purpureum TaxID=35688 RepID=A0A5J4YV36_PORPP|nr:Retrovirus-related Pol polyprotein from transposon TNT 1-94 [Porphyridium purpureum]|eukprot:POR2775..scf227_4